MQTKARPSRSPMTLRAMRRDIAILTAAATVSISFSAWVHGQTCSLEAEPPAPARLHAAVAAPQQLEQRAVLAQPKAAPLKYGEHFAFVVDLEEPYIVLATDVDASWEGSMDNLLGVDTAFRNVDVPALPESLQAMEGRSVALWTTESDGRTTSAGTARIGAPRLVAQASGTLGPEARLDTWALYERLERDGALPGRLEDRVKRAIWADGMRLLVAPLEGAQASDATWARSLDLAEPVFFAPADLEVAEQGALRQAFLATPDARTAADEHLRMELGSLVPHIRTQGWTDASGELQFATAFIDSPHVEACGGFDWSLALGAQVRGGEWAVPGAVPSAHTVGPAFIGDLNADGFADMFLEPRPLDGNTMLLQGSPEGLRVVDTLEEIPYFGCRC